MQNAIGFKYPKIGRRSGNEPKNLSRKLETVKV